MTDPLSFLLLGFNIWLTCILAAGALAGAMYTIKFAILWGIDGTWLNSLFEVLASSFVSIVFGIFFVYMLVAVWPTWF